MGLFSKKSAPQPSARPEYIEVGQIVNTHGVRGEVKVQPWDVSPELLCGFKTFYMDGAPFRPTSKRVQGDMVLMKLPEVDDMDAAAALKRKVLSIRRNDVQLKPGEHFDAEIIGMNVYNYFPHTYIGTVVDVLSYPAHKLYKVKGEEKTYLIPAVKDIFITDIDEEKLRTGQQNLMVTPRDIDQQVRDLGKVIGYGINWALQDLDIDEMNALLS